MNEQQRNDWAALRSLAQQLAETVLVGSGTRHGRDLAERTLEAARKVKAKR